MRFLQYGLKGLLMLSSAFVPAALVAVADTTGTIEGTVVDETGAVVSGAKVTLTHVATGVFPHLEHRRQRPVHGSSASVGNYQITVQLTGFTTVKRTGIAVALGQTLTVDMTLKLASVETTVEVTAAAPLIETCRSEDQHFD